MNELEKIVQHAIDSQRAREVEKEKMIAWRANPMTPEELRDAEELVKYAEIRMAERAKAERTKAERTKEKEKN